MNRVFFISVLMALVAGCSKSSFFQGIDVASRREQQTVAPRTSSPEETWFVPPGLLASIHSHFPGHHLPNTDELTGAWAVALQPVYPPFICWGDFNGDGLQDAAMILFSAEGWKFVIFEQRSGGHYEPVYVARGKQRKELGKNWAEVMITAPQKILLQTVRKGQTWAPEGGDTTEPIKLQFDAVQFVSKPRPDDYFASLIVFKNGKYQQLFDDSLVAAKPPNSTK